MNFYKIGGPAQQQAAQRHKLSMGIVNRTSYVLIYGLLAAILLLPVSCADQEQNPPHTTSTQSQRSAPQLSVQTAIPHAIRLIEENRIQELLTHYMAPAELQKQLRSKTLKQLADKYPPKKRRLLLQALKSAQNKSPRFSGDGTKAVFDTKPELKFIKIGKRWYIY